MPDIKRKLLLGAVNLSCQVYRHLLQKSCTFQPTEKLSAVLKSKEPVIFAILHQDVLTTYPFLHTYVANKRFCSLASLSKDGEFAAYIMEKLGITTVRGSSSRQGIKGFLELVRLVKEENYSVIFPCDGPRRPYGKVQPGVAMLSSMTRVPIYLLRTRARHQIILEESPPKLFIPRPFSDITAQEIGPIQIERRCSKEAFERHQAKLQQTFETLIKQVDDHFNHQK